MAPSLAFLFPGQNSRYPSMIEKAIARDRRNVEWMERASDALGRDLASHYRETNPAVFARNRDVQIGVFLANHLHWQSLERAGVRASFSAGLSLGEYNHLVHIGALDFEDALRLVDARGAAYENGPSGKMAAVFPVAAGDLEDLLMELGVSTRVGIGMVNTPRQCVISGEAAAVDAASAAAEDALGAETVVIESALPMHSRLFRPVGDAFRPALAAARWREPVKPYLPNVTGRFETNAAPGVFVDALSCHVWSTVRWCDSVESIIRADSGTTFVETGPKSILTGFFGKKWRSPARYATDAAEGVEAGMETLLEELTGGSGRAARAR